MYPVIYLREKSPVYEHYRAACRAAGAVVCSEGDPTECDALLLPGGGDLAPGLYGQLTRGAEPADTERDREELAMAQTFLEAGKPILGICRGMQVLNVALGGTLLQDIPGHSQRAGVDTWHAVRTERHGPWEAAREWMWVNSAHHQAVDRPGSGLVVVQRAEDGIAEAMVHRTLPVLGVQYHPERMEHSGILLFHWFFSRFFK